MHHPSLTPHRLTLSKSKAITRSTSGIPELQLSPLFSSPRPTLAPLLISSSDPNLKTKKRLFLELMGYPKGKTSTLSPVLDIENRKKTISLTDFMGNNKYSFLKKTGFIDIYEQCHKLKESKKLAKKKKTLSGNNIKHMDVIREFGVRSPRIERNSDVLQLLKIGKFGKKVKKERIDKIQEIIDKCDKLFMDSKKNTVETDERKEVQRKKNKKLSEVERNSIQIEMDRIRY